MVPIPDLTILTHFNEEAKKCFIANKFFDALKFYDEGLEKSFVDQPTTLSSILKIAQDSLQAAANDDGSSSKNVIRAAAVSAFVLRIKPFYFDATTTYIGALTSKHCSNSDSEEAETDSSGSSSISSEKLASQRRQSIKAAQLLLKHHLAKDGTDEDAKKLLDSFKKEVDETVESEGPSLTISAASTPEALEDVPHDFATLVGNALNNSALCELKLKRYDAAAASASQALLFLSAADARAKAVFRHAQALLRSGGAAAAEAAAAAAVAEKQLKKAEVKILRGMLAEAKGKHDWTNYLKECLKDEKKKLDPVEYLSSKVEIGVSKTKGLGLVAKEPLKKGEILCVQQAVHYVPPKPASDPDEHMDFTKLLLAEVLKDARNEVAVRVLSQRGKQTDDKGIPTIREAFRRLRTYLPFFRDQISVTQIWEEVKNRDSAEKPLKFYEGTKEHDTESRRLATLISDVVKKTTRLSPSLSLSFDTRYTKTMTQAGGEKELGQVGLWIIPSLLHHAEFPNVTYGTMGGVAIVTAIRDVEKGTPLAAMMGGIQCLPVRLRHLSSLGFSYLVDFDPDYPLTKEQALIVGKASATFEQADNFKMETIGLDPGDAKPKFDKAIDVCLNFINDYKEALELADPLGLAALYFTLADCLGGKKDLSGMVKAYFMGITSAHSALVVNLDTLTRMTKMQKFLPMAKKLEEMQDQAEMVAKNNPSLQEEFKKIARIKNIGPSVGKIQDFLEENLSKGCQLLFSTSEALRILS